MRKETKRLVLGILSIFVLAVFYMLLQKPGKEKGTSAPEPEVESQYKVISLWDKEDVGLSQITILSKKDSIVFNVSGDETLMQGHENTPPNELAFARLALLARPEVFDLELVESDEKKLLEYGLADPESKVTVKFADGESRTFLLGEAKGISELQYLKLEGEDEIYAVEPGNYNLYTLEKEHFVSKSVAPFSIDPSEIELLSITYENGGENFKVQRDESVGNEFSLSLGYAITEPFLFGIDYYKTSEMLEQAKLLYGSIFLLSPTQEELLKYGFKAPAHSMKVEYQQSGSEESGEYMILIGNESGNEKYKEYYVMREGENVIYSVLSEAVKWTSYTAKELASKQVYIGKSAEIKEISFEISNNEKKHDFLYDSTSKIWTAKESGEAVDKKSLDYIITLLGQANGSSYVEKAGAQAQQELVITIIHENAEKEETIEKITLYHYKGYEAFAELPAHPFGAENYFIVPYEVVINILQTIDEL